MLRHTHYLSFHHITHSYITVFITIFTFERRLPCEHEEGGAHCQMNVVDDVTLTELPYNCTTFHGHLIIQDISVLPSKIYMLSNLTYIKGGLALKRTELHDDMTFLNNVRCIENPSGPAITLEENKNLYTLGLKKIEYLSADSGPIFYMVGDGYLLLVDDLELRNLIRVASSDGKYHEEMFEISEISDDIELVYFAISFAVCSLIVIVVIIVGHFILKLHIPKGYDNATLNSNNFNVCATSSRNTISENPPSGVYKQRKKLTRKGT
ncbi:receptor L domain protein [Dictyocaulus viviparus]|uniref:Receptor L domain protein n=1 Tax=Dictyocaulus viviparus TaxID=29172 RepID=A0A0D8XH32_DICVI|nr:receptor L domain protein [Dictyocaulus viviparus]